MFTTCRLSIAKQEHSRVGYLLTSIENNDPGLQAAMAVVRTDKAPGGMWNDFEVCVAHLVPYCPVAKKRTVGTKRGVVEISELVGDERSNISAFGTKHGKGPKTRVQLRYHKVPEYKRLSNPVKEELREWRESQGQKSKGGRPNHQPKKQNQQAIAAAVEKKFDKRIEAKLKAMEDSKTKEGEAEAFVISCLKRDAKLPPKPPPSATFAPVKASQVQFLQSILGRAKNTPPP
jgi:hypothetical protein